jgi:hypothetical protein
LENHVEKLKGVVRKKRANEIERKKKGPKKEEKMRKDFKKWENVVDLSDECH